MLGLENVYRGEGHCDREPVGALYVGVGKIVGALFWSKLANFVSKNVMLRELTTRNCKY